MITSFTKDEQKLIGVVLLVAGIGSGVIAFKKWQTPSIQYIQASSPGSAGSTVSGTGLTSDLDTSPTRKTRLMANGKLDLNVASEPELEALPGVGPSLAKAIIDYRTASGGFHGFADVDNVHGIGPSMMKKLAPLADVAETGRITETHQGAVKLPISPLPVQALTAYANPGMPSPMLQMTPANHSTSIQSKSHSSAVDATPVNLNTATSQQLESLNRVGPALAQRIMDYRALHGAFHTVEELTAVKGIGPKTLELNRARLTIR